MTSSYISENIARFKRTGNPMHLARAIGLVLRQGRTVEVFFGLWCDLRYQPAEARPAVPDPMPTLRERAYPQLDGEDCWPRAALAQRFGAEFPIDRLPAGFAAARREAIAVVDGFLVLGEYGESRKRIALLGRDTCWSTDFYERDAAVRHIHAVHEGPRPTQLMVTTGDRAKYLDVWERHDATLVFMRRLKKRLAGHTAIARVGDHHFLGSDMSSRLNYLERLDGRRIFFPRPASRMYVVAFVVHDGRYLLSLHKDLSVFSRRQAISVFDTHTHTFIGCEAFEAPARSGPHTSLALRQP